MPLASISQAWQHTVVAGARPWCSPNKSPTNRTTCELIGGKKPRKFKASGAFRETTKCDLQRFWVFSVWWCLMMWCKSSNESKYQKSFICLQFCCCRGMTSCLGKLKNLRKSQSKLATTILLQWYWYNCYKTLRDVRFKSPSGETGLQRHKIVCVPSYPIYSYDVQVPLPPPL